MLLNIKNIKSPKDLGILNHEFIDKNTKEIFNSYAVVFNNEKKMIEIGKNLHSESLSDLFKYLFLVIFSSDYMPSLIGRPVKQLFINTTVQAMTDIYDNAATDEQGLKYVMINNVKFVVQQYDEGVIFKAPHTDGESADADPLDVDLGEALSTEDDDFYDQLNLRYTNANAATQERVIEVYTPTTTREAFDDLSSDSEDDALDIDLDSVLSTKNDAKSDTLIDSLRVKK